MQMHVTAGVLSYHKPSSLKTENIDDKNMKHQAREQQANHISQGCLVSRFSSFNHASLLSDKAYLSPYQLFVCRFVDTRYDFIQN